MGKKKGSNNQAGFQKNLSVIEAANQVVKPFVRQEVQLLGRQLQQEQNETLRAIYTRLTTLEGIVQKELKISDDQLAELVADTEDKGYGLKKTTEAAKEGDYLRITASTKAKDQEEYQGVSKLVVAGVGQEPFTLGPELEPELIGMKAGETKEVEFGKNKEFKAKLEVNRVSRRPEPKKPKVTLKKENKEGTTNANAG